MSEEQVDEEEIREIEQVTAKLEQAGIDDAVLNSESESDEEEEEEDGASAKKGKSRGYKFKKFFASKTVGTKAGRKVIVSALGKEGEFVVQALKGAMKRYKGKSVAREFKTDVLKIAIKAKLQADEGLLTAEKVKHVVPATTGLSAAILHALLSEEHVDPAEVLAHVDTVRGLVVDLMAPHMRDKNQKKLEKLFDLVSDPQFIDSILNNQEYAEERKSLKDNLFRMVDPSLVERVKTEFKQFQCMDSKCSRLRMREVPGTPFLGSNYCREHHDLFVMPTLENPDLRDFLDPDYNACQIFLSFLRARNTDAGGNDDADSSLREDIWYHFYDSVRQFKQQSRSGRKKRAELITRKFFRGTPLPLDPELVQKIVADVESGSARINRGVVFDEAVNATLAILDAIFHDFLQDEAYREYVEASTPPQ